MTGQVQQTPERQAGASPVDQLKSEAMNLAGAAAERVIAAMSAKVEGMTSRLLDSGDGNPAAGVLSALTGSGGNGGGKVLKAGLSAVKGVAGKASNNGSGGSGQGKAELKATNIAESIDVGVPVRLAYNQWTQFADFPAFMKKVESVEQESEETLNWRAQILWSHRTWKSTIMEQEPDSKIIWRSEGQKGHVDGSVTFHELTPDLTRILVVLAYYPQGGFEHIGNIWRAPGRRTRLELKHFRRHVMTQAALHPEEVTGWRGVIKDGEVVKDHETAVSEEDQYAEDEEPENAYEPDGDGPADEYDEDTDEDPDVEDDYDADERQRQ